MRFIFTSLSPKCLAFPPFRPLSLAFRFRVHFVETKGRPPSLSFELGAPRAARGSAERVDRSGRSRLDEVRVVLLVFLFFFFVQEIMPASSIIWFDTAVAG